MSSAEGPPAVRNTQHTSGRRTRAGLHVRCVLCAVCCGLMACQATPRIAEGRVYPKETGRGATLDIQVVRRVSRIELTNTTARPFGPSTLWLNGRFSREIHGLDVGEHVAFSLREFRDEFGDEFRGGGFFASELSERLVLAEIETKQPDGTPVILGLVVVGGQE